MRLDFKLQIDHCRYDPPIYHL